MHNGFRLFHSSMWSDNENFNSGYLSQNFHLKPLGIYYIWLKCTLYIQYTHTHTHTHTHIYIYIYVCVCVMYKIYIYIYIYIYNLLSYGRQYCRMVATIGKLKKRLDKNGAALKKSWTQQPQKNSGLHGKLPMHPVNLSSKMSKDILDIAKEVKWNS